MSKFRNWCFTLNNYDVSEMLALDRFMEGCKYGIYGIEVGKEGTPHLQGYVELKNPRTLKGLKRDLPRCHLETRKGTAEQALEYCKKEGNFKEFGKISSQGKRTDIEEVKQLLRDGNGMQEIVEVASSYQSMRMAELYLKYKEKQRDPNEPPRVIWIYGPTGTGKTKWAWEYSKGKAFMTGKNLKWWDGYDRHEYVIIDDYRADFCQFSELLRILDRYPYTIEVKGGSRQLVAQTFIITTPQSPEITWANRTMEDLGQLMRRITDIVYCLPTGDYNTLKGPLVF